MTNMLNLLERCQDLAAAQTITQLRTCNRATERFGLVLREEDVTRLAQSRAEALETAGRVELDEGILPRLIYALCDSPYLRQDNYVETLEQLQEAFYYFKTEAQERYTDDELIEFMAAAFDGPAQGSVEYVIGTSLERLCRRARGGGQEEEVLG